MLFKRIFKKEKIIKSKTVKLIKSLSEKDKKKILNSEDSFLSLLTIELWHIILEINCNPNILFTNKQALLLFFTPVKDIKLNFDSKSFAKQSLFLNLFSNLSAIEVNIKYTSTPNFSILKDLKLQSLYLDINPEAYDTSLQPKEREVKLVCLTALTELQKLKIRHDKGKNCHFSYKDISCLTNLRELDFSNNQHIFISFRIKNLMNIVTLNISDNHIHDLAHITNLIKLKSLNISKNYIKQYEDLTNLKELTYLNLANNKDMHTKENIAVPQETLEVIFAHLTNLKKLYLDNEQYNKVALTLNEDLKSKIIR